MKTKKKKFDAVLFMREQREEMSKKLSKMTAKEIVEYFRLVREQSQIKPSA